MQVLVIGSGGREHALAWKSSQDKSVSVIDSNNKIVGSINPTKIINTVFGGRKNNN